MKHLQLFEDYPSTLLGRTLYHCSSTDFEVFDTSFVNGLRGNQYGEGLYFTDNLKYAKDFDDILYTCKVLFHNPINLMLPRAEMSELLNKLADGVPDEYGHLFHSIRNMNRSTAFGYIRSSKSTDDFKAMGYDGVIGDCEFGGIEYVAYYPEQITILSKEILA